jgi:cation transport ATPase
VTDVEVLRNDISLVDALRLAAAAESGSSHPLVSLIVLACVIVRSPKATAVVNFAAVRGVAALDAATDLVRV